MTRPGPVSKPTRLSAGSALQVSDVLYILRDVATGLSVVHAHKARPPHRVFTCTWQCAFAGTGPTPATSAPGLGSPLPRLHLDWAHPCHICTGNGLTPATSAPGLGALSECPESALVCRDTGVLRSVGRASLRLPCAPYKRRMLADRPSRCQGAECAAARGGGLL